MNEDKKSKLKQSLEEAKQKLDELKTMNPNGNYDELEKLIQKMNEAVYQPHSNQFNFVKVLKILAVLVIPYIFCSCSVTVVFGFMNFILTPIEPILYATIIPITSLVLYLSFRIMNIILNQTEGKNSIYYLFLLVIALVFILAYVDQTWIHLCDTFSDSLLLCFGQVIIALIMDLFCTQRLFYFLGDIV